MTARARRRPPAAKSREERLRGWAAAQPTRAAAARDEHRISDVEDVREYGHLDALRSGQLALVQDRYERSLGWGVD